MDQNDHSRSNRRMVKVRWCPTVKPTRAALDKSFPSASKEVTRFYKHLTATIDNIETIVTSYVFLEKEDEEYIYFYDGDYVGIYFRFDAIKVEIVIFLILVTGFWPDGGESRGVDDRLFEQASFIAKIMLSEEDDEFEYADDRTIMQFAIGCRDALSAQIYINANASNRIMHSFESAHTLPQWSSCSWIYQWLSAKFGRSAPERGLMNVEGRHTCAAEAVMRDALADKVGAKFYGYLGNANRQDENHVVDAGAKGVDDGHGDRERGLRNLLSVNALCPVSGIPTGDGDVGSVVGDPLFVDAARRQDGSVAHYAVDADLCVAGVEEEVGEGGERAGVPGFQLSVQEGCGTADLAGGETLEPELGHDLLDIPDVHALDVVHLGDGEHDRARARVLLRDLFTSGENLRIDEVDINLLEEILAKQLAYLTRPSGGSEKGQERKQVYSFTLGAKPRGGTDIRTGS